jgi:hypothetical protein
VTSITATDAGIPTLSITAAQAAAGAGALADISGTFSVTQTATGSNLTIVGVPNALGNMVTFTGTASQYSITPTGDGVHFTVATTGSSDQLSNVQALQFSDYTLIVAQAPGASTVTGGNITELYSAVFGRVPDLAGLSYYEDELKANPLLQLTLFAQDFLASPEYADNPAHTYAQATIGDTRFITDTYNNLLHRAPEAEAIPYYLNTVIAPFLKGLTPATAAYASAETLAHAYVVADFSASQEYLTDVQVTAQNPASAQHFLVLV